MDPNKNIEEILKNLSTQNIPTEAHQITERTCANFSRSLTKAKQHILWSDIMKSRITKLAAAAAIIIAAALLLTFFEKSVTPAYAIEETIEALSRITSVHVVGRGWDNELVDAWMKIDPETGRANHTYLKTPFIYDGRTFEFSIVSTPKVSYQYNETENVVKIFERQLIQTGFEFDRIFESIAEKLDENQRMEVYRGKDPQSGNEVIVLLLQSEDKLSKILIDPDTKLPISIETFGPQKTDLKRTERITYNEPIPEGVFDFQIPENAKVINVSDIEDMLDRPDAGIPADNLTKKEASLLVAKEYWLALINKDWSRVEQLRPIHSAEQWSEMKSNNPPVELVEVGQPYWQKGCSEPVTPCIIKYSDGRILEIKTYPRFRDRDGKRTCVIGGTYAQARELNQEQ